jgi:O-antigen ligase/polysaccharide polymerase Wzy-like membrane protein
VTVAGNGGTASQVERTLRARRAVGFVAAFGFTLFLALDGGGYDIILRQKVGLVIWALIALGILTGFFPRARWNLWVRYGLGGLAGLAALMFVAHSWTQSDERTTAEMCRVLQYLGIVALVYLGLNRHTWQGAAAGFAAAALLVPMFSVGSRLFPTVLVDDVSQNLHFNRLSYPFGYWNAVACWGAMALAIALGISAHAPRRWLRMLALATVPATLLSMNLAYSRFGLAMIPLVLVVVFALSRHRWTVAVNWLTSIFISSFVSAEAARHVEIAQATGSAGAPSVLVTLVIAGAICAWVARMTGRLDSRRMSPIRARRSLVGVAILGVLFLAALHGPISHAWDQFKNDQTANTATAANPSARLTSLGGYRYTLWQGAWDAFKTDPERGIGPGTFEFYWDQHGDSTQFIRNPHSLYLQQLGELGIFGLVAILVALGGMLAAALAAWRRWTSDWDLTLGIGLIAAFIAFAAYSAVDWVWELSALGTLALGGCAVVGASGLNRQRPRTLKGWAKLGVALCCLLFAAAQVPTLISSQDSRESVVALGEGDASRAEDLARDAIDAQPWAATPYAASALALEAMNRLPQARAEIDKAISREPTNWRLPVIRARIDKKIGDESAFADDSADVHRLAPKFVFQLEGTPFSLGVGELLNQSKSTTPAAGRAP